jgi:hypothetical protein
MRLQKLRVYNLGSTSRGNLQVLQFASATGFQRLYCFPFVYLLCDERRSFICAIILVIATNTNSLPPLWIHFRYSNKGIGLKIDSNQVVNHFDLYRSQVHDVSACNLSLKCVSNSLVCLNKKWTYLRPLQYLPRQILDQWRRTDGWGTKQGMLRAV